MRRHIQDAGKAGQRFPSYLDDQLSRKVGLPASNIEEILSFLQTQTVEPRPKTVPGIPIRDEDDSLVLASALAANS